MSKDITTENTFDITQAPSHIEKTEVAVESMSFTRRIDRKGQLWQLKAGKDVLHEVNTPHIDTVIIASAPTVSRAYYDSDYVEGVAKPPVCWTADSNGGPDASVAEPQHSKCSLCPQNVKGSGSGNTKACRLFTRVAVGFIGDTEATQGVFQLQLPATSTFGNAPDPSGNPKRTPFMKYKQLLGSNGYTVDKVITRISQDQNAAYKKLLFEAVAFVGEDSLEYISGLQNNADTQSAIETKFSAAKDDEDESPAVAFDVVNDTPKVRNKKSKAKGDAANPAELDDILSQFTASGKVDD